MQSKDRWATNNLRCLSMCVSLVILVGSVSGCETLRKKFIRQKKKDAAVRTYEPILDPIDYPAPVHTVKQDYARSYSLWKVWNRDLIQAVYDGLADKRQKYLLEQVLLKLDEMTGSLAGASRDELQRVVATVTALRAQLDEPEGARNPWKIRTTLQRTEKEIMKKFNPRASLEYVETSLQE